MFSYIKAKHFYSWPELEFHFKSGVTLLAGQNLEDNTSEGVGKSSICEALVWGLYGQSSRDVNIDDVIQHGYKSCSVEIGLSNGMRIIRKRGPNSLHIVHSDGSTAQGKDSKDTQRLITATIGMSFDTFMQSVYFSQNYSNKFITASQEDKAKILSELQNLTIFDKASKYSADQSKDLKNKLATLAITQSYTKNMLSAVDEQLKTFEALSDTYDTDKLKQLDSIIENSGKLEEQIKQIEEELLLITNLNSISDKQEDSYLLGERIKHLDNELYHINVLKIQKQQALDNKNCPTCGQVLGVEKCEDIIIPDDVEILNKRTFYLDQLKIIEQELTDLIAKRNKNALLSERLKHMVLQRKAISKQITDIESSHNPYLDKIQELYTKSTDLNMKLSNLTKEINDGNVLQTRLEFLKTGFKEIKSYVFQSLLELLNRKTNSYLRELFEIPVYIKFDNVSEDGDISKIKTTVIINEQERSLGLLSGGQFRRVQLAVDFALSDIVSDRAENPINIRILDEVMKDLSETSMSKVVDILQRMPGCTVLIEHNSIVKSIVNEVYNIEYKNGVSKHIP